MQKEEERFALTGFEGGGRGHEPRDEGRGQLWKLGTALSGQCENGDLNPTTLTNSVLPTTQISKETDSPQEPSERKAAGPDTLMLAG